MRRPDEGRWLAGVCAGLASRFGLEPALVRLAFCVLALARGLGVLIYLVLWMTTAADGKRRAPLAQMVPGVRGWLDGASAPSRRRLAELWRRVDATNRHRRRVGILLVAGGGALLLGSMGLFTWIGASSALALTAIVAGLAVLWWHGADGGGTR